jgi:hypothetical protein
MSAFFMAIYQRIQTPLAQLAQMQALPRACAGRSASTSGVKIASTHQQRSGAVPVARAFSMAQVFGDWHMGHRVGSMVSIE